MPNPFSMITLHDDRLDPIAGDPLEHSQEARPLGHGIGPAHCRVVETRRTTASGLAGRCYHRREIQRIRALPRELSNAIQDGSMNTFARFGCLVP